MYSTNDTDFTPTIGAFTIGESEDFRQNLQEVLESFTASYEMNPISDVLKIVTTGPIREDYKNRLLGDIVQEQAIMQDEYYGTLPEKMEQLFENNCDDIVRESNFMQLSPIVGLTLPIMKKNFIEGHAKDIVMTEIPTKPIIKHGFERKFLKDRQGKKYYIPDIFYDNRWKEVVPLTKGNAVDTKWYPSTPGETVPFQDLNILGESGGTIEARDTLGYDFHISGIRVELNKINGDKYIKDIDVNIAPKMSEKGAINYRLKVQNDDGSFVEELVTGQVDFYYGTVSIASTGTRIKQIRFGGHLSNENNKNTVEIDRERDHIEWVIEDGQRLNSGYTLERLQDNSALFNIEMVTEAISDMSTTLTQFEDSMVLDFLRQSLGLWKHKTDFPWDYNEGFVEEFEFSAAPPSNVMYMQSQWIASEMKFTLSRQIDKLKKKLREKQIMFVVYGNPSNITLLQDGNVRWIISQDTKIGGVQLDYSFGVLTDSKDRVHVISSQKVDESEGIRIVAFPLTKELVTFKHFKYSMNIENNYRNPITPLTPNIMATSRHKTVEVLPVQGLFEITNNTFGRKTGS